MKKNKSKWTAEKLASKMHKVGKEVYNGLVPKEQRIKKKFSQMGEDYRIAWNTIANFILKNFKEK